MLDADLPVISLQQYCDADTLAQPLREACTGPGFFYLTEHGIPAETTAAMFALMRRYFQEESDDEKLKYNFRPESGLGYSGLGRETLDPTKHSAGDCKESFYLERLSDSAEPLPVLLETEKDLISSFHSKLESISLLILSGLEKVVGVKAQAFTSCHGGAENRLRLIHYPGIGKEAGSQEMRASAHTDYGSITLLTTESVGGLQISKPDGQWADVPYLPDAIVVNIADALEFWSGGTLKSTLHRVVLPRSEQEAVSRLSMAFFVQPDFATALQVMTNGTDFSDSEFDARLAEKGIAPGTRRLTSGEFLKARLARTYS